MQPLQHSDDILIPEPGMKPDTTSAIARNTDGHSIVLGDDPHVVLKGNQGRSPKGVFMVTMASSLSRGGQPVRCTNFMRGISLLLEADIPPTPAGHAQTLVEFLATAMEPPLRGWLKLPPAGAPLCLEFPGVKASFAHHSHLEWLPGVMQIDVEEPSSINEFLASPSPKADLDFSHLEAGGTAALPPDVQPHSRPQDFTSQSRLSEAVRRALECSIKAMTREYSRIPFPVRFRASGALDAWAKVRREAGATGARLEKGLGDVRVNPSDLIRETLALVDTGNELRNREDAQSLVATVSTSIPSQAFWLRGGALFEPTDALEQLLRLSDVSDDLPLAAIARNARALCIVPGPGLRQVPDCVDSIMIFDHEGVSAEGTTDRWLTLIVPREDLTKKNRLSISMMRICLDNDNLTIREAIERYYGSDKGIGNASDTEEAAFWMRSLSYVFKILFYLSSEQPRIIEDNAWTNAPRNFSGLGKRRRSERLREIDQLYDRYIVGPEVISSLHERNSSRTDTGEGGERSPHWRRGHFRLQRHGPNLSRQRVIFIMPIIVRADLLEPDAAH